MKKRAVLLLAVAALALAGLVVWLVLARPWQQKLVAPAQPPALSTSTGGASQAPASDNQTESGDDAMRPNNDFYQKIAAALEDMTPGADYVEHEVVCASDSKRDAEAVATALGGELTTFSNGVAVITIPGTVRDLMNALAGQGEVSLRVTPNYLYRPASG